MNYLVVGRMQRSRTQVSWGECNMEKVDRGLNLINLEDAIAELMAKWPVKAIEPGGSNLNLFLRCMLSQY